MITATDSRYENNLFKRFTKFIINNTSIEKISTELFTLINLKFLQIINNPKRSLFLIDLNNTAAKTLIEINNNTLIDFELSN